MPDTLPAASALREVRSPQVLHETVTRLRAEGAKIGFVPTMGALHEGHLALVREARARADKVVVSIFVNPLQFAPTEDLDRYPRQEARDLALLAQEGCDIVYLPRPEALYPQGFVTRIEVNGPALGLETDFRPQFFSGVATVVLKLFNQVKPDVAIFGEKDYQQLCVIRALNRDFDLGIDIVGHPTVREPDGLAMSSRNAYLSREERLTAPLLHRQLQDVREALRAGADVTSAMAAARDALLVSGFDRVDYLDLRDAETLDDPEPNKPQRLLVAAGLGRTRLIDNIAV